MSAQGTADTSTAAAPGEGSRRSARAEEMTSKLLDAAEDLYASDGPAGLTNRRIGEQAGTTTQAIYTYFGSRDALLEAMFRRAIEGVEEIIELASAVASGEPSEEEVVSAFKAASKEYRRFCLAHPARLRMIRDAATDETLPAEAVVLRRVLVETISQFGRSGTGEQTAAYEARVHMTISAMHGFFDAELDGFITAELDPDALFDELVHRCLVPYDKIADL